MSIEPGTILVSTWGYDQTNVDFYRVVRSTSASVWLQGVGQELTGETGFLSEYVVPSEAPIGDVFRRKAQTFMGTTGVSLNSYASARVWDGTPVLQTHYH